MRSDQMRKLLTTYASIKAIVSAFVQSHSSCWRGWTDLGGRQKDLAVLNAHMYKRHWVESRVPTA
jgi:hypothetical protein